jgi:8-oxo-dGTP diphosphatase
MRPGVKILPLDRPLNRVLLGRKRGGNHPGKIVVLGGGVEPGETLAGAAVRELAEESGLKAKEANLWYAAGLRLEFANQPVRNQTVTLFRVEFWQGEPEPSEEIEPLWFDLDQLPIAHMWPDVPYWLPKVIMGQKFDMHIQFDIEENIQASFL